VDRNALAILALTALTAVTLVGEANATTVAIVQPENPSPIIAETLVRLEGELRSVGFETAIIDVAREKDGHAAAHGLEQIGSRWRVDAVVAVFGGAASGSVDLWVVNRMTGRTLERTATLEPGLGPSSRTLAIRALELLRSSMLELDLSLPARPPPAPTAPAAPAAAPAAPAAVRAAHGDQLPDSRGFLGRGRVGVELGGAVVASTAGLGPAFAPLMRIGWAPRPEWAATLVAAGLGTRPTVRSSTGSAEVSRDSALLVMRRRFRTDSRVRPLVSLGAGALRTTADGSADAPNQGHRITRWSLLLEAALGAELRLDEHFFLMGATQVQVAEPYLAVRLVDEDTATVGRPDLLLTLSLGAWL
jgi:hypothetical protein